MNSKNDDMGVSKNRGTPKSSILIGVSIINHPFWGTIIFGHTHMFERYRYPGVRGRVALAVYHLCHQPEKSREGSINEKTKRELEPDAYKRYKSYKLIKCLCGVYVGSSSIFIALYPLHSTYSKACIQNPKGWHPLFAGFAWGTSQKKKHRHSWHSVQQVICPEVQLNHFKMNF